MAYVPVSSYDAGWSPSNNKYQIRVLIAGNPKAVVVPIDSEVEFAAVLLMLGKAGILIDTANGALKIPVRPVGS